MAHNTALKGRSSTVMPARLLFRTARAEHWAEWRIGPFRAASSVQSTALAAEMRFLDEARTCPSTSHANTPARASLDKPPSPVHVVRSALHCDSMRRSHSRTVMIEIRITITPVLDDGPRPERWFRNYYTCPLDDTKWADEWSCMCNDRCPVCNAEIQPDESLDMIAGVIRAPGCPPVEPRRHRGR